MVKSTADASKDFQVPVKTAPEFKSGGKQEKTRALVQVRGESVVL
jgi:hypothetical protein